ncbi:hypothetical protein Tco_0966960 [Tanacetum coccineum]
MLALKGLTYNEIPTFANPMYLKKAQSEKLCLYEILYDKSDLANLFSPDKEETLTLEQEGRSKLNKDKVKPYDYTQQNSLYENFKPPSREYLDQLAQANEVQKKMWRKSFVKNKPHILQDKNIAISELKKLIEKMKGKSVDPNFEKQSILGKPPLQPIRNQPVVRQPTAYKSERSQVAKHRKSSFAKPYDVNAPGPSRNCPKHVSFQSPKEFVGSNDMVHNCYLEEAKKKAQLQKDKPLNTNPSVH